MTEDQENLVRETAAVIRADIRVALAGGPLTPARVRSAFIEAVGTLQRPLDASEVVVERDATDTQKIRVFVPADWLDKL